MKFLEVNHYVESPKPELTRFRAYLETAGIMFPVLFFQPVEEIQSVDKSKTRVVFRFGAMPLFSGTTVWDSVEFVVDSLENIDTRLIKEVEAKLLDVVYSGYLL